MDAKALDLNDVLLFVRVVRTLSFSAAARERGVPVSTVSRRISRLEAALGLRLLERTTRRLRLTEAGRTYFAHAEAAVDGLMQGGDQLRALQTEPRGRVRIVAPTVLGDAIARSLYRFLAAHREVAVDLELADRRAALLAEGYDITIVIGAVDTTDFVARELWPRTRKLLYANPAYLAERGRPRRIDDLARHDLIATHATDGMATWTFALGRRKRQLAFAPRLYLSDASAAYGAALAGVGIAMLPEARCTEDVRARRLVRVLRDVEGEAGGVALLYRVGRSLTLATRACIEHLLAELTRR